MYCCIIGSSVCVSLCWTSTRKLISSFLQTLNVRPHIPLGYTFDGQIYFAYLNFDTWAADLDRVGNNYTSRITLYQVNNCFSKYVQGETNVCIVHQPLLLYYCFAYLHFPDNSARWCSCWPEMNDANNPFNFQMAFGKECIMPQWYLFFLQAFLRNLQHLISGVALCLTKCISQPHT